MYAQDTVSVINTSTLEHHQDALIDNGILTITGCPPMNVKKIKSMTLQAGVAEVLTATGNITPTAAASTRFIIKIEQWVAALGTTPQSVILDYTTAASGDTATTITDAWKRQLDSFLGASNKIRATRDALATGVLALTPLAGSAKIRVTNLNSATTVANTGVTGTARVNTYAALILEYPSQTFVSGKKYDRYVFEYERAGSNAVAGNSENALCRHTLLIQDDALLYSSGNVNYASAAGATATIGERTMTATTSTGVPLPGMPVAVTAGNGTLQKGTEIVSITDATHFETNLGCIVALAGGASVITGTAISLKSYLAAIKNGTNSVSGLSNSEASGF